MAMSKRDYIKIAAAFKSVYESTSIHEDSQSAIVRCIERIADVMQQDNPLFDRGRFLGAICEEAE